MKAKLKKAIAPTIIALLCVAFVAVLVVKATEPPPEYETRWLTAEEWQEYRFLDDNMGNIKTDQMIIKANIAMRDSYLKDKQKEEAEAFDRRIKELSEDFERKYGEPINEKNIDKVIRAIVDRKDSLGTTERVYGVVYVASLDDVLKK